jgi:hypothetical protein
LEWEEEVPCLLFLLILTMIPVLAHPHWGDFPSKLNWSKLSSVPVIFGSHILFISFSRTVTKLSIFAINQFAFLLTKSSQKNDCNYCCIDLCPTC